MRPSIKLVLAAATLAATSPAFAEAPIEREVIVRTGDLDLTTDHGVARLDARVQRAALEICDGLVARANQLAVRQCAWRVAQPAQENAKALVLAAREGGVRTASLDKDIALSAR